MTDNPEQGPLNEWLFDEYIRVKDALADLTRRHEEIVNHLADVCRRNDRMQAAGDWMASLLLNIDTPIRVNRETGEKRPFKPEVDQALQQWGEANV